MPQPCTKHPDRPQLSCDTCYPDFELESSIEQMRSVKFPGGPSTRPKKNKRLDEMPTKRKTWKDDFYQ